MTSKPSAKIICDSISPDGVRLTTMAINMHRFVLAEFNTHRVFSRNSASSRAIPVEKRLKEIIDDSAYPIYWGSEKKGMSSGEELCGSDLFTAKDMWIDVRLCSTKIAKNLISLGLHKSLINRLLEPFMWHTVVVTATQWTNFFAQRCSPLAQPEMKAVADAMQLEYYTNEPKKLQYGEWHLPFIDESDWDDISCDNDGDHTEDIKKISTARCARVSYKTHDGIRDHQEDLNLFERLKNAYPMHASPFEHVATPFMLYEDTTTHEAYNWNGNFRGWKQFRKEFENENVTHFVPNHPLIPCSSCSSVGFEKMKGTEASGKEYDGCAFCAQESNFNNIK